MDYYHYLQIVLLGIVEGVTEFLPISSTGHLLIAEHMLGTQEPDIFNVVIQAGAILAVVFIYWKKLIDLFTSLNDPASRDYLIKIALAFLVTTATYLVVSKLIGHHKLTESLANVAWATLIGGFVIFGVEFYAKRLSARDGVTWFESVVVGLAQVVAAIFPGASRSGSTIMAGLALGMKRVEVTQFSFLVGIPTMFAASVFATYKSYKAGELTVDHQIIIDTAIGFIISGIVAFFVVKWLLRFVQSHTFNGFAIYRVILGGGLLIGLYTNAIPDITNEEAPSKQAPLIAPAKTTTISTPDAPTAITTPVAPEAPKVEYTTNNITGQAAPIPVIDASNPAAAQPASALPVPPPLQVYSSGSDISTNATMQPASALTVLPPPATNAAPTTP